MCGEAELCSLSDLLILWGVFFLEFSPIVTTLSLKYTLQCVVLCMHDREWVGVSGP